jgi:transcriptional regulator with XRE-family HTH domain
MTFGENVRRLRAARYLSQDELAKASGVSKGTILRIEQGRGLAHGRTVRALATALRVEPSELVAGEELLTKRVA